MTELDPSLNYFPEDCQYIHLMGICGTGMAALAGMLKSQGFRVTGSDANVYPPMSDFLADQEIDVLEGYKAENLTQKPDLVVVGNVITQINPEAQALASFSIPYVSLPQALGHRFLKGKQSLVVSGTHGKTTTSSMLATLLHGAGLDPGFMIGGIVQAFGRNFRIGNGSHFVVEGDEYDTAFFDKGPKFLHYQPHIAIITSIEFDHADIYADLDAIKNSFRKLVAIMPQDGCLIAHLDDPVVREIVTDAPCAVIGYGKTSGLDWVLANISITADGTSFEVIHNDKPFGRFFSQMPGAHNALNSLAVIAVMSRLGLTFEIIQKELASFAGVCRRQEVRGIVNGITVIDDFAHHPTAVKETVAALADAYAGRRLVVVFEPRTNTSRRSVFQQEYVKVFDKADKVVIKEPDALQNIPEEERFSSEKLVDHLVARGVDGHYFQNTDLILDYLLGILQPGDVVAILSNGGFDNIHTRLLTQLEQYSPK
jgi:UDP-N-acetylmuramate: L-alanyl-gamma-D-glutamyl-meso-diaminopimelate ligase